MTKRILSILLLTAATVVSVWAGPVDRQRAEAAAVAQIKGVTGKSRTVKQVQAVDDAFYVVNLAPQGWVMVSADDKVDPVIGYSATGALSMSAIPDNMAYMLDSYKKLVKLGTDEEMSPRTRQWESVGKEMSRASGAAVEPLIKVKWNQPTPFNKYCPGEGDNKALVGCVAVAMSQAMSVQAYPSRPTGSVKYTPVGYGQLSINFDEERAYNWDDILSGANTYDEAARLMWHAGMSVKMGYGPDGSGIPSNEVNRISNALRDNFGYGDEVTYVWKDAYQGDWERLVLNELNAGRAVIYNAVDTKLSAGHSFNVDGYDGNSGYHVNWGWGGNGDGYFRLDNLRDSPYYFDDYHVIVIGIGAPDRLLRSIGLSGTVIEEGLPAGSTVATVTVNGEAPTSGMTFELRGLYNAGTDSYAEAPFVIENGMLKTTRTLSCSADGVIAVDITVTDNASGESLTQGFSIEVQPWRSIAEATSMSFNRTTGEFLLKTKHNVSYTLKSAAGIVIASGALDPLPQLQFNRSQLADGVNVLELRCNTEVKTITITK